MKTPPAWPLLALLLSACQLAPVYEKPAMPLPPAFKETVAAPGAPGAAAAPALPFAPARLDGAAAPDLRWWRVFDDVVLNELQDRLLAGNEGLRVSAAQMRVAQAAVATAEASLWPTLGLNLGASRSANALTSPKGSTYSLGAALASWELDLWGRLANASDGASARYLASVDDLQAARLSAQALLCQTYFSLRAAEAQGRSLGQAVSAYQRTLALTRQREQAGVAGAVDVAQATAQLRSTESQALDARTQRAQLEHALALLLGQPPAAFSLAETAELPAAPALPQLLPATLLERRPDIAAAERRVAAANAQIGVARAAYFPALTLSANAGFRGSDLAQLVQVSNRYWSWGPGLALGLFDGGARQAASDSALAALDQASASYRQTVLTALQEVEDNLIAGADLAQQQTLQQQALQAAQQALALTEHQYRAGTQSYLAVVQAQATALAAERSWLDVRNRRLAALNQLLKNLAGRWDAPL